MLVVEDEALVAFMIEGIPFTFVTGYDRRGVEPCDAAVPVVQKPFQKSEIDQVLRRWR